MDSWKPGWLASLPVVNPTLAVFLRRGRQLGALLAMALLSVQLFAPAAGAATIAQKRAQAARLAAEIETAENRVSIAAERVNVARIKADSLRMQVADAEAKMADADRRAGLVKAELRSQAVNTYMRGGAAPATVKGGDPARADAYVRMLAGAATDALDDMRATKINMAQRRDELNRARAQAEAALASVKADERAATAADAALRATLRKVTGELATLVAAEQNRRTGRNQAAAQRRFGSEKFGPIPGVSAGASNAVNYARAQLGKPYHWGGAGPDSFDCSGLTMMAWRAGGVSLPHSSQSQYSSTTHIPLSAVQPGDLIFYYSDIHHVGIYVGGGQIIAATHTGDYVRQMSMYYSPPVGAGRPGA
jgi:cell wall-associated NlpC family hydrolase